MGKEKNWVGEMVWMIISLSLCAFMAFNFGRWFQARNCFKTLADGRSFVVVSRGWDEYYMLGEKIDEKPIKVGGLWMTEEMAKNMVESKKTYFSYEMSEGGYLRISPDKN